MDLNIDDFYRDCAAALLQLYGTFPRKMALYVEDLIGREEPDEFGLPSKRHLNCLGAMVWLSEEGYLRFSATIRYEALEQVVLTEKAFLRLSRQVPHAIEQPDLPPSVRRIKGTLAHQLNDALQQGHSEKISRLARLLFETPSAQVLSTQA
ncbi:hypothetical protein [Atopomonas sediminilitoris]|uniref:hypothetical protein n=1 Tax=Atopomonas sediminilitoris TaxID=2919919 RepID=UPI001F4D5715|nr:hypothetical protein [Atopomonas sediminilitoris]MCJ8168835.1 hypothetical protein [Atopomonas sediminilitoris]